MMWSAWWVWGAAAVLLGIGELLLPAQILLGFAIGAGLVSLLLFADGTLVLGLSQSLPLILLLFGIASLIAWILLRRLLGIRPGQKTTFDHDINEN